MRKSILAAKFSIWTCLMYWLIKTGMRTNLRLRSSRLSMRLKNKLPVQHKGWSDIKTPSCGHLDIKGGRPRRGKLVSNGLGIQLFPNVLNSPDSVLSERVSNIAHFLVM